MSASDKYKAAMEIASKALQDAHSVAREAFTEGTREIFQRFPKLQAFRWRQYTPYFNDGDACEFYVYASEPDMKAIGDEDFTDGYEIGDGKYSNEPPHPMYDAAQAVSKYLGSFGNDMLERIFGDHVEVTCDREKGASADVYDHD